MFCFYHWMGHCVQKHSKLCYIKHRIFLKLTVLFTYKLSLKLSTQLLKCILHLLWLMNFICNTCISCWKQNKILVFFFLTMKFLTGSFPFLPYLSCGTGCNNIWLQNTESCKFPGLGTKLKKVCWFFLPLNDWSFKQNNALTNF